MKSVIMTFGRFQPPTKAHESLIDLMVELKGKLPGYCQVMVFPSMTFDKLHNPIPPFDKYQYMKHLFPKVCTYYDREIKSIWPAIELLDGLGYDDLHVVAGGDRVAKYEGFKKYIGRELKNIKTISIINAGSRADSEISGTVARKLARDGDFDTFKSFLPTTCTSEMALSIYMDVRQGIGIDGKH